LFSIASGFFGEKWRQKKGIIEMLLDKRLQIWMREMMQLDFSDHELD